MSCTEGDCIGGLKSVTCSASPAGLAGCDGTDTQTSCGGVSEVPFFTLMNALVAGLALAGFYFMKRRY
jgi:hypothetical protein